MEELLRSFLPPIFFEDLILGVIIWEVLVLTIPFTITIFVLHRFLFKPMMLVYEERDRRTSGARVESQELEVRFQENLETYETKMAVARQRE